MNIKLTLMFFEKFKDDNMSLLYSGDFSDDITSRFIDLSEHNINIREDPGKMKRKVSFLMAECFQNIVRHGEAAESTEIKSSPGFFLTKNIETDYFISSGNLIDKNKIDDLKGQLNNINSLSREELKDLYRQSIDKGQFSRKGGAGLGLIDMARKSGEKIEFSFNDFDEDYSLFYNQIKLRGKDNEESPNRPELSLNDSIDCHKIMDDNKILLVQKGDFSNDSIIPILNVIEQNLMKDSRNSKKSGVYLTLVELLQNIGKHSLRINNRNEGILLLGKNEDDFIIMAGNYIEKSMVSGFKKKLKKVRRLSKEKLKKIYLKELSIVKKTNEIGDGLGLIDIARKSSEKLNYRFQRIDQRKVFFSIKIRI